MPVEARRQDDQELEDQDSNANQSENEQQPQTNENNNGRISNTAQLLQQLSPLMSSLARRPPVRSLNSQAHSYIRYFIFIEFLYIYILDHSLLFFFFRMMSYLILAIMRSNHRNNSIVYWTSITCLMLIYHFLEVFLIPSVYFEYEGVLRVFGPSSYNWLKSSQSVNSIQFWRERIFLFSERVICDIIVWILGYLSIFIVWKRDSLEYLRESNDRMGNRAIHDDDTASETQGNAHEDIQIVVHNNVIESNASTQPSLVHRRRSIGDRNQGETIEHQDVEERRNLLSRNGSNDDDLFDSMM